MKNPEWLDHGNQSSATETLVRDWGTSASGGDVLGATVGLTGVEVAGAAVVAASPPQAPAKAIKNIPSRIKTFFITTKLLIKN